MFSKTNVSINAKHYKPFGCPTYILDKSLQTNLPFHKWKQQSRMGNDLGPSPQHTRNVALVMDRATGLVSPQFHVKFDPSFQSVKDDNQPLTWQLKAGLVSQRESANSPMARQNQQLQPANAHDAKIGAAEKVNGTTRPSAGAMASHGGNNSDTQVESGEQHSQDAVSKQSQRAECKAQNNAANARGRPKGLAHPDSSLDIGDERPTKRPKGNRLARVGP